MNHPEELIEKVRVELSATMCPVCFDCLYDSDIESIIEIVMEESNWKK